MTEFEKVGGCVYHTITVEPRRHGNIFRVDVYRDGVMVDVDPGTGEATFEGGRHVATVYRRSEGEAHGAGIRYSFVTKEA